MKDKLSTIVLASIFVALVFFCNSLLNKQNVSINTNSTVQANIQNESVENVSLENYEEESNMEILSVSNENFESEVLKSEKPVLIDFYADWCGPCKMVSPIVEQIAKEHEDIKVVKVNIDDNQDLAVKYGVTAIPTLIVIKNGEESNRTVGVASQSEIEAMILKK